MDIEYSIAFGNTVIKCLKYTALLLNRQEGYISELEKSIIKQRRTIAELCYLVVNLEKRQKYNAKHSSTNDFGVKASERRSSGFKTNFRRCVDIYGDRNKKYFCKACKTKGACIRLP